MYRTCVPYRTLLPRCRGLTVFLGGSVKYRYRYRTVLKYLTQSLQRIMLYRFVSHFHFLFYFHILLCVILIMLMIFRTMIMGRGTGCRAVQLASIRLGRMRMLPSSQQSDILLPLPILLSLNVWSTATAKWEGILTPMFEARGLMRYGRTEHGR